MHPQPPRRTTHTAGGPRSLLVYDRWGQFGRPVLLLHGLLFDRTIWWPAAAELAGAGTVVAPDLPGHGLSPGRAECALDRIAHELALLVEKLGLHRAPLVVGHATSARLALAFADAYATHDVITLDEPAGEITGVDDLIGSVRLDGVPEQYRPYAEPRRDAAMLGAYRGWLAQPPTRRTEPALAGRAGSRSAAAPETLFAQLRDPAAFAADLRSRL